MDWYYSQKGERKGPVELDTIKALVADGTLSKNSLVWNETMGAKWSKVGEVTVLAGPQIAADDPAAKMEFARKMEERNQLVEQQRQANVFRGAIAATVVALLVAGGVVFAKSKSKREWGVSSSCPIGTLAKLEARLVGVYQMEKEKIQEFAEIKKQAAQIFRYSNPKYVAGEHITAKGEITVTADNEGRVQAILCRFPSPGLHGYLLNDRSIASILMNELWTTYGGPEERVFQSRNDVLAKAVESCGFTGAPEDGVCAYIDKERMRCIWTEFGPNTVNTMVYFEAKR